MWQLSKGSSGVGRVFRDFKLPGKKPFKLVLQRHNTEVVSKPAAAADLQWCRLADVRTRAADKDAAPDDYNIEKFQLDDDVVAAEYAEPPYDGTLLLLLLQLLPPPLLVLSTPNPNHNVRWD